MKKTITLYLASILALALMSFGILRSTGIANQTGGHGEGGCTCHSSVANAAVTVNVTASGTLLTLGYVAGTTYTINVNVAEASQPLFAFDFQALNAANASVGTLTAGVSGDNSLLTASSLVNVVHNGGGTFTTGSHTFTFTWLAPAATTGAVTFWYSGMGSNNSGTKDAGDHWNNGSKVVLPASSPLSVSIVGTNVTCNGANNGSATATATGGTSPYTYSWAPSGGTAATATGLVAGTYTCTVTGGGTASQTITITQPAIMAATVTQTNVLCNGGNTGSATITASGGTSPYTYSWAPSGGTAATATGLAAGTYTCTITGSGSASCTLAKIVTITQPGALTSSIGSQTNVLCNGSSTGAATITAGGGTSPYTYSWAPSGGTAATASGLAAGTYTCTITDANLCTKTQAVTITQPSALTSSIGSQTNVLCNGSSTGSATITAGGGTSPYTYSWAPSGGTAATASGLAAGTYTCTVKDANLCTKTQAVTITQPSALTSSIGSQTNVSCNGSSNGSATITAGGGTSPYTYSWAPSGGTAATASGLAAGSYTCTITDANLCTKTQVVTITQPAVMAATTSQINVLCNGGSTGSATVTASGGTSPYTYSWAPSGGTAATATGLAAGTYTCTITGSGSASCTITKMVNISQPPALASLIGSQTNVLCNGSNTGAATIIVVGGTSPYTYSWAPSGGTAATASGLAAGTYTCTIRDANLCTQTQAVTITQPSALTSSIGSQTNVLCNGSSTGSATITAGGGTSPYAYSWAPSGGTAVTASGLNAGTYTCTITDANLCTKTQAVTITQPSALTSSIGSQTNVSCNGSSNGSATITAGGGTSPYTYSWAPSGGTAATASGLAAGSYTCTITDANLCTKTQVVSITQPAVMAATTSQINALCNGSNTGSATVTASGGTSPYTYSWAPSGGTAVTATGLAAGTYTCTITGSGSASCTLTKIITITQPGALTSTITSQTTILCNGSNTGAAAITAGGGTSPYTYSWAPNGGTGSTASGLAAGTYTCTITDANLCTKTQAVTITQPSALTSSIGSQTNVLCNGSSTGSATITAGGGTSPYAYSWAPSGGTAVTASGLNAGTYTCTITDANLCTKTQAVTITQPSALASSISSQTNVSVNGGNDGSATIFASGGTSPYSYSWAPSGGTSATATGLTAGTYTCTISDANLCTKTEVVTIIEPSASTIVTSIAAQTNILCNGDNTGSATITQTGGTAPYTYSWAPSGGTFATATGLAAGTYTCTVNDAAAHTQNQVVTITQPLVISIAVAQTNVECNGGNTGSATITASGGNGPYSYAWVPSGGTGSTASGLAAGTYTCTITDANSCTKTQIVTIAEPSVLIASILAQGNVSCYGACDGFAQATVTGGVTPYSFIWTPGSTAGGLVNNLCAATYTVLVTDANACSATTSVTITEPSALSATTSSTPETIAGNGTASVNVSGGTTPYYYLWNDALAQTTSTATALTGGNYSVAITDANGCTDIQVVVVNTTVGINSTDFQSSIKIYPNPSKDNFSIEINAAYSNQYTLKIMNPVGKLIYTESLELSNGKNLIPVSLSGSNEGLYFVQIISSDGIVNIPVTKLK